MLWLYAIIAVGDFALHIVADHQADEPLFSFASITVAFAGSLFWPLDIIARLLLSG